MKAQEGRRVGRETRLRLSTGKAIIPAVSEDMGNPPWEGASSRILIVRLSSLRDVELSSTHLVLFSECRQALGDAYIDFGFFPGKRDRALLAERGGPYFFGLESGRPPEDFDLILVSCAFALELVNLSYLFELSPVATRASERAASASADAVVPIVILGGSNATAAGALLLPGTGMEEEADCLVDGIFFGEGEGAIGELASILTRRELARGERLELATSVVGFWAAMSGKAAVRKAIRPHPPALSRYPVLNARGSATAKLQISAGCPGFCSFCLEGWASRPYREYPLSELARAARELKASSGASSVEVYSYNFNAHSEIFPLLFELGRVFRRVELMSQRLELVAESPILLKAELASGKRSFTLGVEGLSRRMRSYYRKGLADAQVEASMTALAIPAVRELKLFYIIAGIEAEEDLAEFAAFARAASERRRISAPGQRIIVSAGYLARLPFTPLQYTGLCLERDRLEAIAARVQGACSGAGIEFRLAADFEEHYVDQVLAMGGRSLGPWLERSCRERIAYDASLSRGAAASLEAFAEKAGILGPDFFGEKAESWLPPLAFADRNEKALRREYALASAFAPDRGRFEAPPAPEEPWLPRFERLMVAKRGFVSTPIRVILPPSLAAACSEYRSAWVLRSVFRAGGGAALASVFDAQDALFAKGAPLDGMAEEYYGLSYYYLVGPDGELAAEAARAAGMEAVASLPPCDLVRAELSLDRAYAEEGEAAFRSWLAEARVDFIETRGGGRTRHFKGAGAGARKGILLEAELLRPDSEGPESFRARLVLGPKARLGSWLARLGETARASASLRFLDFGTGQGGSGS